MYADFDGMKTYMVLHHSIVGVPDRYVDAFCGRVPRTVLASHYTDFSPESH